jgi:hypothetical protein
MKFPTEWEKHKIHVPNHQPEHVLISEMDD